MFIDMSNEQQRTTTIHGVFLFSDISSFNRQPTRKTIVLPTTKHITDNDTARAILENVPSIDRFKCRFLIHVRLFVFRFHKVIGSAIGHSCTINTNAHGQGRRRRQRCPCILYRRRCKSHRQGEFGSHENKYTFAPTTFQHDSFSS